MQGTLTTFLLLSVINIKVAKTDTSFLEIQNSS